MPKRVTKAPKRKRTTKAPQRAAPKRATEAELLSDLVQAHARIDELEARVAAPDPMANYLLGKANTDEGHAEHEETLRAEGRLAEGHVSVGVEPFEKSMEERGDNYAEGREPWEVADPFGDTARLHTPKGHVPRFLSPLHVDKLGKRGWEYVKDAEGRQVRQASLLLASMPKEKAEKRKKYFRDKTRARTRETVERHREAQRQAKEAGLGTGGNEFQISRSRRVTDSVPA